MPEKTYSERRGGRPISDPYRYMHQSRIDRGPTEEELAAATRRRDHELLRLEAFRRIVDWVEVYKYCPRKSCRRTGGCSTAEVDCFWEAWPLLREHVFPDLLKAVRKRQEERTRLSYDPAAEAPATGTAKSVKQETTP